MNTQSFGGTGTLPLNLNQDSLGTSHILNQSLPKERDFMAGATDLSGVDINKLVQVNKQLML